MLLIASTTGCGARKHKVYPVNGRIVCNDKGVPNAFVVFHPTNGPVPPEIPMLPNATTDETGAFRLSTYTTGDGAPAGSYKVVVIWPESTPKGESESVNTGDRLQGRYATPEATSITIEVKPENNALDPIGVR